MTNKIVLRTNEEFLSDFKPLYTPIWPLLINNGAGVKHSMEVGQTSFRETKTIGDIRNRRIDPKSTEVHQIHSTEGVKTFHKYFDASQYIQSSLQDTKGYETVKGQALDEHNLQFDEMLMDGGGINNGLIVSSDANHTTNSSYEIKKDAGGKYFADMYDKMSEVLEAANRLQGDKLVFVMGDKTIKNFNSLSSTTDTPLSKLIQDAFPEFSFNKMSDRLNAAGREGLLIVNLDQIRVNYIYTPAIDGEGVNEEKRYIWTNFLSGSSMVDVRNKGGVTYQPFTFQA